MQTADVVLGAIRKRGTEGKPLGICICWLTEESTETQEQ